jgi:hypothetical protein
MRIPILCLFLTVLALPAYAGHGTIEETDDGYIVDYTSDDAAKPAENGGKLPAAGTSPAAPPAADRPVAQAPPQPPKDPEAEARSQIKKNRPSKPPRRPSSTMPEPDQQED